ncbi:hypothetical protein NDU88_002766 [Pleurodeles waltl]|uniref:Uncharacterized protein n=1 Tax=Pleurodeles waltl TaxID=8319 RepID=A0AAV7LF06_PLEWA|nr:hypothetical protein NDU88_002766 [Pleurodeles waltl]
MGAGSAADQCKWVIATHRPSTVPPSSCLDHRCSSHLIRHSGAITGIPSPRAFCARSSQERPLTPCRSTGWRLRQHPAASPVCPIGTANSWGNLLMNT